MPKAYTEIRGRNTSLKESTNHEWEWNKTPYLKFSFHILVEDEVTEAHEMELSNIRGKVVFSSWI